MELKIAILLLLASVSSVFANPAYSQLARVSLFMENTSLEKVMDEIEKQSEFYFILNQKQVDVTRIVNIQADNKVIAEVLPELFKGTNINYSVFDRKILLTTDLLEKPEIPTVLKSELQQKQISGIVTDESGSPLPGVNVQVEGASIGTITNVNGKYSIDVPDENSVLVFTFVGYTVQKVNTAGKITIDISLVLNLEEIDEVVVIGYGSVRKKDLTGSVSSVKSNDIGKMPLNDPAKSLTGKAAGVLVTGDTKPGQNASILIRGKRSFNATNDPLLVVDGIPVTSSLGDFPPSIIESIEILKDASATAIYGSRAANGVILVTTKKGKYNQKGKIEYNAYTGIQTPFATANWMNGAQFADYVRDAYRSSGKYTSATPDRTEDMALSIFTSDPNVKESLLMGYDEEGNYDPSKVRSTNWNDILLRTGSVANHQLSFSGGGKDLRTYLSFDYYNNKGVSVTDEYSRYSLTANLDYSVNKWLKLGLSTNNSMSGNSTLGDAPYRKIGTMNPLALPYDSLGNIIVQPGADPLFFNPLLDVDGRTREQRSVRLLENFFAEVNFGKGFKYKLNLGFDGTFSRSGEYFGPYSMYGQDKKQDKVSNSNGRYENLLMENILTYNNTFGEDHSTGVTLAHTIQTFRGEGLSVETQATPFNYQLWYNVAAGTSNTIIGSSLNESALESYLGRVNYSFKDRYLLTASMRMDGSSVFSVGNKFDYFPSAALAWRISQEDFMSGLTALDDLKLRVGYGKVGNSSISPYSTQGSLQKTNYLFETSRGSGEIPAYGYAPSTLRSSLKWEATAQTNIGVDFTFLKNFSGTLDYYYSSTTDLLMYRYIPMVTGFDRVMQNIGSTSNRGVELSFSSINVKTTGGFTWVSDLTIAYNDERIEKLYKEGDDVGNKWFVGKPIDVYYDYSFDRLFQQGDEDLAFWGPNYQPGDIKIVDRNNNYLQDAEDMSIIGKRRPDFFGGFSNTLTFKGIELYLMLYGKYGNMINNDRNFYITGTPRDVCTFIDYWTPSNTDAKFPGPRSGSPSKMNTMTQINGSYLRVRNLSLAYSFPQTLTNRLKIEKLRAYLSVQEPHIIWTSKEFAGVDPEYTTGPTEVPNTTIYSIGLNVSF